MKSPMFFPNLANKNINCLEKTYAIAPAFNTYLSKIPDETLEDFETAFFRGSIGETTAEKKFRKSVKRSEVLKGILVG